MASYFDLDKQNGRLYFVTKNTDDVFVESNLQEKNINEVIFKRLKDDGYENIVFYSLRKKLFFYDYDSKTYTTDPGHSDKPDDIDITIPFTDDFDLLDPVEVPSSDNAENPTLDSRLHMGRMTDLDIQKVFEARMKDDSRKTAIVIENADDYVRYFGSSEGLTPRVASMFNEWEKLPSSNKNIIVFIFPKGDKESFDSTYSRCPIWDTYFKGRFKSGINIIEIAQCSLGEIKNLINKVRVVDGLKVESSELEYIVKEITAYYYTNNLSLKALENFLVSVARKGERLSKQWIIDNFHNGKENNALKEVNELIGMQNVKDALLDLRNKAKRESELNDQFDDTYHSRVEIPVKAKARKFSLHYALTGNPGTGKTTVAQYLGMIFKELGFLPSGHLVSAKRDDLVAEVVGGTAIKTQAVIDRAMGGVLFIDEAYALFKEDDSNDFGREAIDTLIENMTHHDGEFAVVIAGYPKEINRMLEKANPGFSRRFKSVINIEDYSPEELVRIFDFKCKSKGYACSDSLHSLVKRYLEHKYSMRDSNWGNAGVVDKLVDACYDKWCSLEEPTFDSEHKPQLSENALPKELQEFVDMESKELSLDSILKELDSLIGLKSAKDMIAEIEANIEMGDNCPAGHYFFTGNPGTGKTTVARIMGSIFKKLKVLSTDKVTEVSAPELIAGYVGQTPLKTKKVLEEGRDGVVLIDEVSTLSGEGFNGEARSTILKFMEDNRKRISIICTGYPNQIKDFLASDPGFLSRFDAVINFDDYTADELVEIMTISGKKQNLEFTPAFIDASKTIFEEARKDSDFGNGRYVRKYLEKTLKLKNMRLKKEYGSRDNVPESELRKIKVADIGAEYKALLAEDYKYLEEEIAVVNNPEDTVVEKSEPVVIEEVLNETVVEEVPEVKEPSVFELDDEPQEIE